MSELRGEVDVENVNQDHRVSYLWARLDAEEREEVLGGDNPAELSRFYGIRPQPQRRSRKKWIQ